MIKIFTFFEVVWSLDEHEKTIDDLKNIEIIHKKFFI